MHKGNTLVSKYSKLLAKVIDLENSKDGKKREKKAIELFLKYCNCLAVNLFIRLFKKIFKFYKIEKMML